MSPVPFAVFSPLLALSLLPLAAAADRWSDWKESEESAVSAHFEPSVDMRSRKIDKSKATGFANLSARIQRPGALRVEGLSAAGCERVVVSVDAVEVPEKRSGVPSVAKDGHYAENPFLPYALPSGKAGPPHVTVRLRAEVPPDGVVRVPALLPLYELYNNPSVYRLRWSVSDAATGRMIARGVLPEAFTGSGDGGGGNDIDILAASGAGAKVSSRPGRATPSTFGAWPMLVSCASSVRFDGAGFDEAFGNAADGAARTFAARALLAGLDLAAADSQAQESLRAAGYTEEVKPVVMPMRGTMRRRATPFQNTAVSRDPPVKNGGYASDGREAERREKVERAMLAARIPGETLERPVGRFVAASVSFLLLFAAVAVAVLVRRFALCRGEARLAAWRELPLWSAICTALALFVLPRLVDRRPYADVTEWRYGIDGLGEALCCADGRAQTFEERQTAWAIPAGAWFERPYGWREARKPGRVVSIAENGSSVLVPPPRTRGEMQSARAWRFAPHRAGAVLSPDPAFDFDAFLREAKLEPGAPGSDPEARRTLGKLLSQWCDGEFRPSQADVDKDLEKRSVTALVPLDGAFAFCRGAWYSLGPMAGGETRRIESGMKTWEGMDTRGKPYANLFAAAPFAIDLDAIRSFANVWLARERDAGRAGENDEDGPNRSGKAKTVSDFDDEELSRIVRSVGSGFVVAVAAGDAAGRPFIEPVFPEGSSAAKTTGRVVFVEAFP